MPLPDPCALIKRLASLPKETEWVEFKQNNSDPEKLGESISALANAAMLHNKRCAYFVFGIEDETHALKGSSIHIKYQKKGNEELENWILRQLTPRIGVEFYDVDCDGQHFAIIQIQPAFHQPVAFAREEYIRVGSYNKRLSEYPEKARTIWSTTGIRSFETGVAASHRTADELLKSIDFSGYFRMINSQQPDSSDAVIYTLCQERFAYDDWQGGFDITNIGALSFAKDLNQFDALKRKAIRVVVYNGKNRIDTQKEQVGKLGYANGFEGLIVYIQDQLPQSEEIKKALRVSKHMYPEIAIREIVANALIHQDLSVSGDSPMVEIFSDRLEVINPGTPLIDTQRFIDEPPQSRNEILAALMRRLGICEERGSGIDKAIAAIELHQLPAPSFVATERHTKVILYSMQKFADMSRDDRVRACYQHACLKYVSNENMTNSSLRERFSMSKEQYPQISRVIADSMSAGLIKPLDPNQGRKFAKYIPFWA